MIPEPRPLCNKLIYSRHNERKFLIEEYIVYFIFDLRTIREKNSWTVRLLAECTPWSNSHTGVYVLNCSKNFFIAALYIFPSLLLYILI